MSINPVVPVLGRRIRMAVIGGGPGSFIGAIHRQAARFDDAYELVNGVFSSKPEKNKQACLDAGFPEDRICNTPEQMLEREAGLEEGADAVAIMTPNDSHYRYASRALELGFDVICDKPVTNTVEEAEALCQLVEKTGRVFCLTHNDTGYPMVRQARALVKAGRLGTIRLLQVEYVQGGKANEHPDPETLRSWRYDPEKGGPSLVMGDIGTHAHNLLRYITGLEVEAVTAEAGAIVPGRKVDDYAGALLRMDNGARGSFWVTQAAAGVENCLRIRVSGTNGSLEWMQELPQILSFKPLNGPVEIHTPNGPGVLPLAARSCRIVAGHPGGFHESFANIYRDAAMAIAARRSGTAIDPLADTYPKAEDGLAGVRFIRDVLESSRRGRWVQCRR